jgi:type III secretion system YscJ/HrcJ family lipoprotein
MGLLKKGLRLWLMGALFLLAGCKTEEIILENLSQNDANEILVALASQKIPAQKKPKASRKEVFYQISVDKKQAIQALRVLVANRLPQVFSAGLKEVFPPGQGGIIPTKGEEMARNTMALQGEIERLLYGLPKVMQARVVLNLGEQTLREGTPKSASVALLMRPNDDNSDNFEDLKPEIKSLVSKALGSASVDSISVMIKKYEPVNYLATSPETPKSVAAPTDQKPSSNLLWILLCITILALLIGGYGALRIWQLRNSKKNETSVLVESNAS